MSKNKNFELKILGAKSALERTEEAIKGKWADDEGRKNQARAFIKRAKKSDKKKENRKSLS